MVCMQVLKKSPKPLDLGDFLFAISSLKIKLKPSNNVQITDAYQVVLQILILDDRRQQHQHARHF